MAADGAGAIHSALHNVQKLSGLARVAVHEVFVKKRCCVGANSAMRFLLFVLLLLCPRYRWPCGACNGRQRVRRQHHH